MNGFELAVAWLTVQVSLVLIPAIFLHLWASRRGPAQGAWVAVASLVLVLVLSLAIVCPRPRIRSFEPRPTSVISAAEDVGISRTTAPADGAKEPIRRDRTESIHRGRALTDAGFIRWIETLRRGARRSASHYPRGANAVAILVVAGVAVGMIRLMIGLLGIGLCRRRGIGIEDPELVGLLETLRGEMGCRARVELRAVPDLGTAATAGWRRPLILLPDDWRSWDEGERRAVLAHELAHIVRADYAAGLLARLALALHFYHPLVRWLTGRLMAQQELAADAVGARFAGGKDSYVLALSRLALRQDERAMFWPARAFLPAKGTLIRRIEMLTNQELSVDQTWSRRNRLIAVCLLLAVGVGVLVLPGPSRGDDEPAPKVALKESAVIGKLRDRTPTPAIDLSYLPADAKGFIAIQPAAICRREGMNKLINQLNANPESRELLWLFMMEHNLLPNVFSEPTGKEMPPSNCHFHIEDIEQITSDFWIDQSVYKGKKLWRLRSDCQLIRMVKPFDWGRQVRIWWPKLNEVRDLRRVYYKINSPFYVGKMCVYVPDDCTIVMGMEAYVREIINRDKSAVPRFVEGLDWKRIQQSPFVMALDNHAHQMAGILKKESGKDAVDLSRLFEHADLWAFHLEDSDLFSLKAFATCASSDKSRPLAIASEETLIEMRGLTLDLTAGANGREPVSEIQKLFARILEGYEVVPSGTRVNVSPKPAVKLAEFFGTLGHYLARQAESHQGAQSK